MSTNTDAKLLLLQATQPLGDAQMSVLAELVAYMKLLPSQAMKIDFYVDSGTHFTCFAGTNSGTHFTCCTGTKVQILIDFYVKSAFNSTNIKSKHSRTIIPFGGPLGERKREGGRE